MDRFLELTKLAQFPYISANFNKEGELVFAPYVIKEFDGVRYAELYIPARTAIVLQEVKEKPAKSRRKKSST